MMELLQIKNKGKIVLCNAGNFYIAIGKDAILLNELLDLKLTCLKPETCKVGFPIASLEKYTDLIQEKGYGYIVYFFDQEKEKLEVLLQQEGKINKIEKENNNCYICSKGIKAYKKADKYIMAVAKLYEEKSKAEEIEKKSKDRRKKRIWYKSKKKKQD